jgi:hypothetical protein
LVIVLTNDTPEDPVTQRLSGAQTQIFVRLTIGAMREALKLVEKRFLASPIGKEFVPLLDPPASAALDRLKRRFAKLDALTVIRDSYAFHHPTTAEMEAAFQTACANTDSEEADWAIYFNRALLNTFFFVSDYVLVHGMTNAVGETDINEAHEKLGGVLAPVANDLSEFTFGFAAAIFKKNFGPELTMTVVAKIDDAPNIDDLRLPFLVETPGLRNA